MLRLLGAGLWVVTQPFLQAVQGYTAALHRYLFHLQPLPALQGIRMELKGRIVVYSIVGCPHCMRAKSSLHDRGLPYTDVSLDSFPQCREFVKERTGRNTVPQIFFNNIYVGGNEELQKKLADEAELQKLVDEVRDNPPPAGAPVPPDPSTAVDDASALDFECEPDEYALLVADLKKSGLIKDHHKLLTTHKNSFIGSQFVDWVVKNKGLDRESAKLMGQALIDQHFGHQVGHKATFKDDDTYYRLLEDDESTALNAGTTSKCEPRPAGQLGEEMRKLILKIYGAFLSSDGKKVDYKGISHSAEFKGYIALTKELVRVQVADSSREEKLAFFINIYNALVIHANVTYGPPTNLWQRYKFFNTVRYIIGGHQYSLQDLENGVLRGNKKGIGMFSKPFGKSDPRLKVALTQGEPLIHFALVCGAKSCPPIKTYSSDGITEQLKLAAESFLEGDDGCQINLTKREVRLSMIFKWYKEDFGQNNAELLQFIHLHMGEGEKKEQLSELMVMKDYKIRHIKYDWGVNS